MHRMSKSGMFSVICKFNEYNEYLSGAIHRFSALGMIMYSWATTQALQGEISLRLPKCTTPQSHYVIFGFLKLCWCRNGGHLPSIKPYWSHFLGFWRPLRAMLQLSFSFSWNRRLSKISLKGAIEAWSRSSLKIPVEAKIFASIIIAESICLSFAHVHIAHDPEGNMQKKAVFPLPQHFSASCLYHIVAHFKALK